jgi:hypothetical protein
MLITITPDELEEEFKESWRMGFISHPHIDYATNAIHAVFEGKDVIIFKFHKYGWVSDNRQNTYDISAGSAGILIKII